MESILGHVWKYNFLSDRYTCERCKIIVFETQGGSIYVSNRWLGKNYYGNNNVLLNITCDEVLIKTLLE